MQDEDKVNEESTVYSDSMGLGGVDTTYAVRRGVAKEWGKTEWKWQIVKTLKDIDIRAKHKSTEKDSIAMDKRVLLNGEWLYSNKLSGFLVYILGFQHAQ